MTIDTGSTLRDLHDGALRDAVKTILAGLLPAEWTQAAEKRDHSLLAQFREESGGDREWPSSVKRTGLSTASWPVELGGLGASTEQETVILSVLADYALQRPKSDVIGLGLVAPTLLRFGTPEQKAEFLPPLARGEVNWCQLFSEPGAGSDLAALSTRATRRDDGSWAVSGQKVWSSWAHESEFGILLARTDTSLPKHQGLTMFIIPMNQDGIEIRPLRQVTGDDEFNEVFFDGAIVPSTNALGDVGAGWTVALSTLTAERSSLSAEHKVGPGRADVLVRRAMETGTWARPEIKDALARLVVAERVHQMAAAAPSASPNPADPRTSILKLLHSDVTEALGRIAPSVEPLGALAWEGPEPTEGALAFLNSKYNSIPGGTSEIQRNIIAERLLGLPRDVDPTRSTPFNEVRRG